MTKPKKKSRKWLIILLIIAILGIVAYLTWKSKQEPKGEEVTTEEVTKRTIKETVTASGRIFPETEVKISSDVSGEIVQLLVEEGDSVVAGQILAKIDPEAYLSAVERGEASLNSTKSSLANSQAMIENARAQKEQINASLINAKKVHERNTKLRDDGVISEVEYEQSEVNLQALEANYKASDAMLNSSEQSAKGAEFQIKSSAAQLKELKTSLNRTTIKAPTNGIVSSLSVEQGERVVGTIQMTGTEMMRIANLNAMEVQVEVSENDILKVAIGDDVDIEVDAYVDTKFKGNVTEIANSAANTTSATGAVALNTDQVTNFIVKIRVDADSYSGIVSEANRYPFRPGMSASVEIFTNEVGDVLTIPIQAVTIRNVSEDDDEDEKMEEVVFVYEADTARMIPVEVGIQDDEFIQITSSLTEGAEIISGPYSLISKTINNGTELRKKEEGKKGKEEAD